MEQLAASLVYNAILNIPNPVNQLIHYFVYTVCVKLGIPLFLVMLIL